MSGLLINVARNANSPSNGLALTNCVIFSPLDLPNPKACPFVIINQHYILSTRIDDGVKQGEIGTARWHRQWMNLSVGEEVSLQPFDPVATDGKGCYLARLVLQVGYMQDRGEAREVDSEDLAKIFGNVYHTQVMTVGQAIVFDYKGVYLQATVAETQTLDLEGNAAAVPRQRGVLIGQTAIDFRKEPTSSLKLKGAARSAGNAILQPNFKFEDMGIGGLGNQFSAIFRRAFASRICPPSLLSKLGIQHVKGLLLFGPPGTGKTLIARQIAKFLNAREPKIVNGPEIMSKYVGQSEENIRKLFADAEAEYREKGDDSSLHIIVFDELDAICKQRGSKNDGTGVGDSIVNQLLSKMDGVEQLNNILIIGMTNRLDMIDEALLRPGRLEVHMEISLPDEKGRLEIIKIHTSVMRKHSLIADDVDLAELAQMTKNFSGAEIAGLVKSASSFAMNQKIKVETGAAVTDLENMRVHRADFLRALDEVKPAYGVSEAEMKSCIANGIIEWGPEVRQMLNEGALYVQQAARSELTPLISILLHGPAGSGKTALAATMAIASAFPFVKLVSPENMIGMSEQGKVSAIAKVFTDAYKSELSCVVVDGIERLLDWVPIGPRFSNAVLQTLITCLRKPPPPGKKLIIMGTTHSRAVLQQMDMLDAFNAEIYTPLMSSIAAVDSVVAKLGLFDDATQRQVMTQLQSQTKSVQIGVKKVLMICERARQDSAPAARFVHAFLAEVGSSSTLSSSLGSSGPAAMQGVESNRPADKLQGLLDGLDGFRK